MNYHEITITSPDESRDALMNRLYELGSLGVHEDGVKIRSYFDTGDIETVCAQLNDFREVLGSSGLDPGFSFTCSPLPQRDWNEEWKKGIVPIHAGRNITILPPWEEAGEGRVSIMIDSGMAFGTGHHETTRTCLANIERVSPEYAGKTLLDIGTGTGILAIGASKMGFSHVTAVDTDPLAVDAARKNVSLNALGSVDVMEGDISVVDGSFDVIIANLISGTLITIAPEIASRLNKGGTVILSGMLAGEEEGVEEAYRNSGLRIKERSYDDKWVTLTAVSY